MQFVSVPLYCIVAFVHYYYLQVAKKLCGLQKCEIFIYVNMQ